MFANACTATTVWLRGIDSIREYAATSINLFILVATRHVRRRPWISCKVNRRERDVEKLNFHRIFTLVHAKNLIALKSIDFYANLSIFCEREKDRRSLICFTRNKCRVKCNFIFYRRDMNILNISIRDYRSRTLQIVFLIHLITILILLHTWIDRINKLYCCWFSTCACVWIGFGVRFDLGLD